MKEQITQNRKKIVAIAVFTVLIALFAINCEKLRNNFDISSLSNPRVAMEDYILTGSGCNWNFPSIKEDSLYVINDATKLQSFVTGGTPPVIDFNQYSLLLVRGTAYGKIAAITKSLVLLSGEYTLNLGITLGIDTVALRDYLIAIKVPKLPPNTNITYNLYYPHLEVWECFEEWSLGGYPDVTITLAMDTLQRNFYISTIPQDLSTIGHHSPQRFTSPFLYGDGWGSKYYICEKPHGETFPYTYILYFGFKTDCINHNSAAFIVTMLPPDTMNLWTQTGPLWGRNYSFIRQNF
jgi:hypothetical protein